MKSETVVKFHSLVKRVALIVPLALAPNIYAQGTAGGVGAPAGAGGFTGTPPGSAVPPAARTVPGSPTMQPGAPSPNVPPPGSPAGAINPAPGTSMITPPSN